MDLSKADRDPLTPGRSIVEHSYGRRICVNLGAILTIGISTHPVHGAGIVQSSWKTLGRRARTFVGFLLISTSLGLATYVMLDPVDGTSLMGWVGDRWGVCVNVPWTCNLRDA